jgi:hypothetical protein
MFQGMIIEESAPSIDYKNPIVLNILYRNAMILNCLLASIYLLIGTFRGLLVFKGTGLRLSQFDLQLSMGS